ALADSKGTSGGFDGFSDVCLAELRVVTTYLAAESYCGSATVVVPICDRGGGSGGGGGGGGAWGTPADGPYLGGLGAYSGSGGYGGYGGYGAGVDADITAAPRPCKRMRLYAAEQAVRLRAASGAAMI
ncbi:unnamed protein product, partial [Phaeothamnion confervicola]